MSRSDDLRLANSMPLHLLRQENYVRTLSADDAPEFTVLCLAADSMHSVLERARKYPGWVGVVCVFASAPDTDDQRQVDIQTRQFLPKQFSSEYAELHQRVTIGRAFDLLRILAETEIDIFRPRTRKGSKDDPRNVSISDDDRRLVEQLAGATR